MNLNLPIKVKPINEFEDETYLDFQEIQSLLRLDHLNEEEKSKLLKLCKQFYKVFQKLTEPLSTTPQTTHAIRTLYMMNQYTQNHIDFQKSTKRKYKIK